MHKWKRGNKKVEFQEKEGKKTEREEKKWQREEEHKQKAEKLWTMGKKVKETAERRKEEVKRVGKRKVSNATAVSMPERPCKPSSLESNNSVIDINMSCVCSILYSDDVIIMAQEDCLECACVEGP